MSVVPNTLYVALFTRAWIEIDYVSVVPNTLYVALFTRAWIEMTVSYKVKNETESRPLHEGVD